MTRAAIAGVALVLAAAGCGIGRVDSPIALRGDKRLEMVSPDNEAKVDLPVTLKWRADGHEGDRFAVYIDRPPLGPNKLLRLRVCTEKEKLPVSPGEFRLPCEDDRETIFFTGEPSYNIECVDTNLNAPPRTRNIHQATIVLLDAENRRDGEAVARVSFEISERDARRCRGLED